MMEPQLALLPAGPDPGVLHGKPGRKDSITDPLVFSGLLMKSMQVPQKSNSEDTTTTKSGADSAVSAGSPNCQASDNCAAKLAQPKPTLSGDDFKTGRPVVAVNIEGVEITLLEVGNNDEEVSLKTPVVAPVTVPDGSMGAGIISGLQPAAGQENTSDSPANVPVGQTILVQASSLATVGVHDPVAGNTEADSGSAVAKSLVVQQSGLAATGSVEKAPAPLSLAVAGEQADVDQTTPVVPAAKPTDAMENSGPQAQDKTQGKFPGKIETIPTTPQASRPLTAEQVMALQTKRMLQGTTIDRDKIAAYTRPKTENAAPTSPASDEKLLVTIKDGPAMVPAGVESPNESLQAAAASGEDEIQLEGKASTAAMAGQGDLDITHNEKTKPHQDSPTVRQHVSQTYGAPVNGGTDQAPVAKETASNASTLNQPSGPAQEMVGANTSLRTPNTSVQAPVFRQVVQNLKMTAGEDRVQIQLHPESLGKVEVSLVSRNHFLEVRIIADTPEAAAALKENLQDLTKGLQDKTTRFQHLDVHVEIRDQARFKPAVNDNQRRDSQRDEGRQESSGDKENKRGDGGEQPGDRRQGNNPAPGGWQTMKKEMS